MTRKKDHEKQDEEVQPREKSDKKLIATKEAEKEKGPSLTSQAVKDTVGDFKTF